MAQDQIDTLRGQAAETAAAVGGAIAGGSITLMTGYADMAAPFASALVIAAKSVRTLLVDFHAGRIDLDALISLGTVACAESAIVGMATAAGQTLIPLPLMGAVMGAVAGKVLAEFLKGQSAPIQAAMDACLAEYLAAVDQQCQALLENIAQAFDALDELMTAAFDLENITELLYSSVDLGLALGVAPEVLVFNHDELDTFMS